MKRFLKILALFLAPVILLLGMFSLALVRSGELTPTADIEAAALDGGLELFGITDHNYGIGYSRLACELFSFK